MSGRKITMVCGTCDKAHSVTVDALKRDVEREADKLTLRSMGDLGQALDYFAARLKAQPIEWQCSNCRAGGNSVH